MGSLTRDTTVPQSCHNARSTAAREGCDASLPPLAGRYILAIPVLERQMGSSFSLAMKSRESRTVARVRSLLGGVAVVYLILAAWGMYRRIWQVQRIALSVPSTTVSAGSTVSYDVITSGEADNLIRLELVQGAQHDVLLERHGRLSAINTIDPRLFRVRERVVVSPDVLARFASGPAVVRLTVFGGQKLLRTPAPRVRESAVTIVR